MFFFFSKLLVFLTYPITWFLVLLFWAFRTRSAVRRQRLIGGCLVLFFLIHNHFLFNLVVRAYEPDPIDVRELSSTDTERKPYGVLLGGYSNFNLERSVGLYPFAEGANRLTQTIELYHAGVFDTLVVSGGSGALLEDEPVEADEIIPFLIKMGIPKGNIKSDPLARTTFESAQTVAPLLARDTSFYLITSAWHLPRAAAVFEKAGYHFTPLPVAHLGETIRWHPESTLFPDRSGFYNWELLFHEWIGYLMYTLSGKA